MIVSVAHLGKQIANERRLEAKCSKKKQIWGVRIMQELVPDEEA